MLKEFTHLLFYKLKSNLKLSFDFSLQGLIKNIGTLFLYSIFIYGAYKFTFHSINYLLLQAKVGLYLLHKFLSIIFFVFFLSVHIGNVIISYSTFYKSKEVLYLFSKPVNFTNIFLLKFLDNFFYSSTTLLVIGIAVIYAYGNYFFVPMYFYFVVLILIFFPFLLIAATLAVIILFLLIKLLNRFEPQKVFLSLIFVYILVLLAYFNLSSPFTLVENALRYSISEQSISQFESPFLKYLPNYWISEFLYWWVKGNKLVSIYYALLVFSISVLMLLFVCYLASIYYRKSFLILQDLNIFSIRSGIKKNIFRKQIFSDIQQDVILKKEFLQFFREPSQWLHLLIMILFMSLFCISIMNYEYKTSDPILKTVSYISIFIFVAFLIASLSLRFIFPALSIEYKNFWKIKSAPLNINKFYIMKLFYYAIPTILLAVLLILFSHLQFMKYTLLFKISLISILITSFVLTVINYSSGGYFVNYSEKSAVRIASTQAASLVFLLSLIYMGIVSLFLSITAYKYFEALKLNMIFDEKIAYQLLLFIFFISVIISVPAYIIGINALKKRDFL